MSNISVTQENSMTSHPTKAIVAEAREPLHSVEEEGREESSIKREEDISDERDTDASQSKKKPSPPVRTKTCASNSNNITRKSASSRPPYQKMTSSSSSSNGNGRGPSFPMVQRAAPTYGGPPPPHYGYPGNSYGPPPPHHYHHAPHPHHHMSMGPPSYPGPPPPYQGGPPPGMKGTYPPPHHPGHPYGPPPPYGMPHSYGHPGAGLPPSYHGPMGNPPHPAPASMSNESSSMSGAGRPMGAGSMHSKKKRTIDGMHGGMSNLSSAYAFRRTDSTSSTTSTVTAGNNTSADSNILHDDSPHRRDRSSDEDLHGLNMDGLMFDDAPPFPQHRNIMGSNNGGRNQHQQQPYHHNNYDSGRTNHGSSTTSSQPQQQHKYHRRQFSGTSTASSLSLGGCSLASYDGPRVGIAEDSVMSDSNSIKRQKKGDRHLVVDTRPPSEASTQSMDMEQSHRLEHLSIGSKAPTSTSSASSSEHEPNIFLSLSTSPINAQVVDIDQTPISKNTTIRGTSRPNDDIKNDIFKPKGGSRVGDVKRETEAHRPSETPTPPVHGELGDSEGLNDDHSTLNHHLRGQSFTPLPHPFSSENVASSSPTNAAFASAIAPQLSWSIAGDTPSLGDLAEWEEEHGKLKTEHKPRPSSASSADTRNMAISPHDFQMWKEEQDMVEHAISGTTTPLPVFFEQSSGEGTENHHMQHDHHPMRNHPAEPERMHPMMSSSNGGSYGAMKYSGKPDHLGHHGMWPKHHDHMGDKHGMMMPPTPMYSSSEFRDDGFGRSPVHSDRRESMDFFPSYPLHHGHGDRIRNLRGRMHPGGHMPPMPLHIPPPMSGHLPMTSPMGLGPGKAGLWSPHHGGIPPPMGSPHHLASPMSSLAQSKRKCVPLKPPIPSKFQGDMEKTKNAQVPEFTSLVNFPSHMSQKQAVNLPEGMRCCVMCGQACPCSAGGKTKKSSKPAGKSDGGLAPRSSNSQDHLGDKNSGYAIIPTQNKGLCTLCDVNVWVVVTTGLEIKWCKGCKNFRPWAAFGDKGLATKCLRCRERQREKYALQKEEKEKTRVPTKPIK